MTPIEKINEYSPDKLARIADCTVPDTNVNEGADFLARVRDSVVGKIEAYWSGRPSELADVVRKYRERIQDKASEAAPDAFADTMWREYVDLRAYQEDLTEFGTPTDDTMEGRARLALSSIAHRLASALFDEIEEASK
ncbi:hypothetical protein KGG85_gp68 [Streptomyces phage Tefunt]|uniref:OCR-like antirestriction protein n=1 Tax=Streptomyces phage Tefunt TaxID=2041209 RepID=A0A291LI13_9CAUD|nr:hypothetical protein KGG85_gp68 [Streptomyces phage Tefunt]ATI19008.1 OCR-like antirestriction protein [Streptomyces phage Tefunt]QAY15810.1 OCR-like antirestriction protein [Streptomyces phage Nishikigoi]